MVVNELSVILNSSSFNGLYLDEKGEVKQREVEGFLRLFLQALEVFFADIHDYFFPDCSIKQKLENRVVDVLFLADKDRYFPCERVAKKVQEFSLSRHFELRKKPQKSWEEKAELAWIRKSIERAGGATGGAYYLLDPEKGERQRLAVFKIAEQHRNWQSRLEQVVKEFFGQRSYLRRHHADAEAESAASTLEISLHEAFAALLPKHLREIRFIPYSIVKEMNGVQGSLQECVLGHVDKQIWLDKKTYQISELEIFQLFVLEDVAMGNLDRHLENWFALLNEEGILTGIKAIDNANTFPEIVDVLGLFGPLRHQYAWAREKIAEIPFTNKMREWTSQAFSLEGYQFVIEAIEKKVPNFLTDGMKEQMKRRFEVLCILAKKENFSPKDLRNYRSKESILRLIEPSS